MSTPHLRSFWLLFVLILLFSSLPTHPTVTHAATALRVSEYAFHQGQTSDAADTQSFLDQQGGSLARYQARIDDAPASAATVIGVAGIGMPDSVSADMLLTLLEVAGRYVSTPPPSEEALSRPFGLVADPKVPFSDDLFAMGELLRRSALNYQPTQPIELTLGSGDKVQLPPAPNAATYAVEVALARLAADEATLTRLIGSESGSFVDAYQQLFAALPSANEPHPNSLAPNRFLYKPFTGSFGIGSFFDHNTQVGAFVRFDGSSNGGYDGHGGTDFPMGEGNNIAAAASGTIVDVAINRWETNWSQWCPAWANYSAVTGVVVQHSVNGMTFKTIYWHLSAGAIATNPRTGQAFAVNDAVNAGEVIGYSGTTGCSSGPHLHFGVQRNGQSVDPQGWCGNYDDPSPVDHEVLWLGGQVSPEPCPVNQPIDLSIDSPGPDTEVYDGITISGWAIHRDAGSGTGVDQVHIYFNGPSGSGATGVAANYGDDRPDVANTFGDQRFRYSGFSYQWDTNSVPVGSHTLYIYVHSTVSGWSEYQRRVTVRRNIAPNTPTLIGPLSGSTQRSHSFSLNWQDTGDPDNFPRNYRDYMVEIWQVGGSWRASSGWRTETSWQVNVPADGTYAWNLQSGDGSRGSAWSAAQTFTVSTLPLAPAAPTNLRVIGRTTNSISIGWNDNAGNETGYRVYRWNGSSWIQIAQLGANATSYTNTGLSYRLGYAFYVSAYNAGGETFSPAFLTAFIALAPMDFNGDGRSDIAWRHNTGSNAIWLMNAGTITQASYISSVTDLTWRVVGVGDFNNDGHSDWLWRNSSSGANIIWLMNGTSVSSAPRIGTLASQSWVVAGVGDFNSDGRSDILWRNNSSGANAIWFMNGGTVSSGPYISSVTDLSWRVVGVGDFNGDGRSDILWRNNSSGANAIWFMNGSTLASAPRIATLASQSWTVAGVGDFSGDGRSDILWRNNSSGANAIWFMNGGTVSSGPYIASVPDLNWRIAELGDFNGNGRSDILWRNSSSGSNTIWFMNGGSIASTSQLTRVADLRWRVAGTGNVGPVTAGLLGEEDALSLNTDQDMLLAESPAGAQMDLTPIDEEMALEPTSGELKGEPATGEMALEPAPGEPNEPVSSSPEPTPSPVAQLLYRVYLPQLER